MELIKNHIGLDLEPVYKSERDKNQRRNTQHYRLRFIYDSDMITNNKGVIKREYLEVLDESHYPRPIINFTNEKTDLSKNEHIICKNFTVDDVFDIEEM